MASKYEEVELKYGKPMSDILINLYERFGDKSNRQALVAGELGISQSTLSTWIKFLRLEQKIILIPPASQPQPTP
jgi:hypothetical protein